MDIDSSATDSKKKTNMAVVMTLQNHKQNMDVCAHAVIRKISYAKLCNICEKEL